jgi:hypothetical protein
MYRVGTKVMLKFKIIRMDHKHCLLEAIDTKYSIQISIRREDLDEHFKQCNGCLKLLGDI